MGFYSDFMSVKNQFVLTGSWYERTPKTPADIGVRFTYTILDPKRKQFGSVIENVMTDYGTLTIKTRTKLPFKPKQYIVTQDGKKWQITEVVEKPMDERQKNALRLFKVTPSGEYEIRLIEQEDSENLGYDYD